MKTSHSILSATGLGIVALGLALSAHAAVNVTQHHNNSSRDGVHVEPAFTTANSANVTRDMNFIGTISGQVYAQPLYVEGGPDGVAKVIAVTETNNVYALNATTGAIIWQRNVGTPSGSRGNISPSVGITGTPVVDLASRSLLLDAVVSGPNNLIFSLNVDTGAINAGWPVNVNTAISGFDSARQSQRAALGILGSTLYVPYGGYFGDTPPYFGRVVGVQIANPSNRGSWATTASQSGIWGPGGIASDGTNLFVTTGNGPGGTTWNGSEAIIRLQPGPIFSNTTADYWAPTNWASLDDHDTDLGGSGPIVVDVPGATPSALVVALGKDGNAYLVNRNTLGGVSAPLASSRVGNGAIIQAGAAYRTATATYVVFRANSSTLTAFKINATNPPSISTGWTVSQSGQGSPFVTTTGGTNNVIVWVVGAGGSGSSQRLHGYNGDTGAVVYAGGGANELMTGAVKFNSGIAARGHIYFAATDKVYKFDVPFVAPIGASAVSRLSHAAAGDFDIPLPLTGTPGIECRSGGATNDYNIVVTFANNVNVTGDTQAQVTTTNADIGTGGVSNGGVVTVKGNSVIIPLTNVPNAQTVSVTLNGVTDGIGYGNLVIPMSRLLGDATGNGQVTSSDVSQVKAQAGGAATAQTFRSDPNVSGDINSTDIGIVKSSVGTLLP